MIRPAQPAMLDRKTAEHVDFLVAKPARRGASEHYINETIIPMLCHKAEIPASGVRGNITSHITSHRAAPPSPPSSTTPRNR